MKCLTIHQPYTELIVSGEKRTENRTWATKYRGPLLIHASVSKERLRLGDGHLFPKMFFGGIVGRCELIDCLPWQDFETMSAAIAKYDWLLNHVHAEGPFIWVLANVERFEKAIPLKGKQRLFEVDDSILEKNRDTRP